MRFERLRTHMYPNLLGQIVAILGVVGQNSDKNTTPISTFYLECLENFYDHSRLNGGRSSPLVGEPLLLTSDDILGFHFLIITHTN